jgi:hypothetical protein
MITGSDCCVLCVVVVTIQMCASMIYIHVYGLACWVLFNMPRASRDEMGRKFCSCGRAHLETCDGLCGSVVLRA